MFSGFSLIIYYTASFICKIGTKPKTYTFPSIHRQCWWLTAMHWAPTKSTLMMASSSNLSAGCARTTPSTPLPTFLSVLERGCASADDWQSFSCNWPCAGYDQWLKPKWLAQDGPQQMPLFEQLLIFACLSYSWSETMRLWQQIMSRLTSSIQGFWFPIENCLSPSSGDEVRTVLNV